MYRDLTLKQISVELNLFNDTFLNRYFQGPGRQADERFINIYLIIILILVLCIYKSNLFRAKTCVI